MSTVGYRGYSCYGFEVFNEVGLVEIAQIGYPHVDPSIEQHLPVSKKRGV